MRRHGPIGVSDIVSSTAVFLEIEGVLITLGGSDKYHRLSAY